MANGTNALAIGNGGATATGTNAVSIGVGAAGGAANAIAIGISANAAGVNGVAIGDTAANTADLNGGEQVAIGQNATATNWRGTAVGAKAYAGATSATAIGRGARALLTHTIAIGRGAFSAVATHIVIGLWGGNQATDVFFDNGHSATYTEPTDGGTVTRTPASCPLVLHGMSGKDTTASPTGNIAGGPLKLAGGQGTGTGAGGSVFIQTSPTGDAGTAENALVDRVSVAANGDVEVLTAGAGLIVRSPNGSRFRIVVSDGGALSATGL